MTNPAEPEMFLRELLAQAGQEAKEEIVSVEDWLLEKGRSEGCQSTLLKLLRLRFGELPEAAIAAVRAAGPEQLDRWLERVMTATALSEVLGES